jgi:arabinofuranosyltransferase
VASTSVDEPTSTPRSETRRAPFPALQRALFAVPVVVFLAAGWAHRQVYEDAFIYLRVVRQLRSGHGPVFNRGQRVEAFTGPLWTFMLTVADLVTPVRLEWLAVTIGLVCGAAGVALATLGARRLWLPDEGDSFFLPIGALAFVAVLPVWIFSSSGLETGLVFGWLGWCLWILASWARAPGTPLSIPRAIVLGLGWLIRPELVLLSALFFVLVLGADRHLRSRRELVTTALAMLALPVLYQVWRMGYYGSLTPNTGIAKEASSTNWSRGSRYFRDFAGPYLLWLPAAALVAGGYVPFVALARRRTRVVAVVVAFIVGAFLAALYVVVIGGDYLHARLLLPAFFAFCAPVAAIPLTRRHVAALVVVPWAIAAMLWLKPDQYGDNFLAHGFVISPPSGYHLVTLDDNGWGENGQFRSWYHGPGFYLEAGVLRYVREDLPLKRNVPLPFGAFYGVGVSAYAMGPDFHVLDLVGLGDSFTAHLESSSAMKDVFAGHEKRLPPPWLAARVTRTGEPIDANDFPSYFTPMIPPTTGAEFAEQVAWARAALKCPAIVRLNAAADAPMSLKRFASNFVHAFENTRVRIPPDPEDAYHKFCGPGTPPEVAAVRG